MKPACCHGKRKHALTLKSEAMDKELEETLETTVTFKVGDMMTYGVMSEDGNEMLAAITGFGMNIRFNMRLINSLADAEATANAMADVFYQALMEQLLAEKADVVKQAPH